MSDWKEVGKAIGKAAPMLATVMGGPVAGGIAAVVASALGVENTPDAVIEAIKTDPDAAVKLAQIEADKTLGLQEIISRTQVAKFEARTREIEAVNKAMGAEAASEKWPQYSWRPAVGFSFAILILLTGITVLSVFWFVLFLNRPAEVLKYIPEMLSSMGVIFVSVSGVVGVSTYQRSREKREKHIKGLPTLMDMLPKKGT